MPDISSPALHKAMIFLAAFAIVVAALDLGQPVLAPVLAALVTGVVVGPLTDAFERRGVPGVTAAFIVLAFLLLIGSVVYLALAPAVSRAVANGPLIWAELREVVEFVRNAVSGVQELQEQVSDAIATEEGSAAAAPEKDDVPVPTLMDALSYGPSLVAGCLTYGATLYFFLATRSEFYDGIARLFPGATRELLVAAEQRVSRYFLAITIVNAGLGFLAFVAMSALGMPQPVIWGLAVFLANYILYLGPAMVAVTLLLVGIVTFDGAMSFVPMGVFLMMNAVEAQFVTPAFVGRQMSLNPLMVFLSIAAWLWLWGPIGGLVAIPMLVWFLFIFGEARKRSAAAAPEIETKEPAVP